MDDTKPWTYYNASHDKARRDMIFTLRGTQYRLNPEYHLEEVEDLGSIIHEQQVRFVHRSELYKSEAPRRIENVVDVIYSIDDSRIYSTVEIGYKEQSYDNINGREEFNFNNTYSTGSNVIEKKLSLISKYRADCYGIEFACQSRGNDSTDTSADKDVFFVYTQVQDGENSQRVLTIPEIPDVRGVMSPMVYNTQFTPMDCVWANEGFICMQSKKLTLRFASSTGNSELEVGDIKSMKQDIALQGPLFSCGTLQFICTDTDSDIDFNVPVRIESKGIIYTGFIQEAVFHYATEEAVKYKLFVKDIELC